MRVYNLDNEQNSERKAERLNVYNRILDNHVVDSSKANPYYIIVLSPSLDILKVSGYDTFPSDEHLYALENEVAEDFELDPEHCTFVGLSYRARAVA